MQPIVPGVMLDLSTASNPASRTRENKGQRRRFLKAWFHLGPTFSAKFRTIKPLILHACVRTLLM